MQNALAQSAELQSPFWLELYYVVTANHQITLEGINRHEKGTLTDVAASLQGEDPETARVILGAHSTVYDDMRKAQRNLALVGVVTRFQHWINRLARQVSPAAPSYLLEQLRMLNDKLGQGPVKVEFFRELVKVRNSIIHADAAAEWEFKGKVRRVADRYVYSGDLNERRNTLEINLTDDDLSEAVVFSCKTVEWYDGKLNPNKIV